MSPWAPAAARRALAVALLALAHVASADPADWLAAVRDAAYARALAPAEAPAVQAAGLELERARNRTLPAVRASEQARLGWDGTAGIALDASLRIPVVAPEADAAVRLAGARLRLALRATAAARRGEVHAVLARAVAVLAADARVGALADLDRALTGTPTGVGAATPPLGAPTDRIELDARLLADRLDAQRREADRLRRELALELGLPEPAPAPVPLRPTDLPPPYGSPVASLASERCLAAADEVALARLAVRERRAAAEARAAQAATRIELELGGGIDLAGNAPADVRGRARLAVSVRLPPWSPAPGAAALRAGSDGLEQELRLAWPNLEPALPPAAPDAADPVAAAERALLATLAELRAQERELLGRRELLTGALRLSAAAVRGAGLADAYLRATVRLQLADVDQALALTRLDAARACGALPP